MKTTRLIMGMPVTIEISDQLSVNSEQENKPLSPAVAGQLPLKNGSNIIKTIEQVFEYFEYVDEKFSTYKETSEISRINRGEIEEKDYSPDMKEIFELAEITKKETKGYFDICHNGKTDPSGIVKGWAINEAAKMIEKMGYDKYFVDAGGDVQMKGKWRVGIRNPFNRHENVKILELENLGVATSGTYIRGQHVYNPHKQGQLITDIVSITVIGNNIYEADRMATGAFAMGKKGIEFIQNLYGFEGYMIDNQGIAVQTSGLSKYVAKN